MQKLTLKSRIREGSGKKIARKVRAAGEIPVVLYGRKSEPQSLTVSQKDLWHMFHTATSEHLILSLDIEGSSEGTVLTMVKDAQHHPVTGDVIHLDLLRISMDEKIEIGVPVELIGVPHGVKESGGVLDHGVREVTINCKPMEIPDKVTIDVSPLNIGDSLHVSDLAALYPALEIVEDAHVTIAHVSAPKKLETLVPEPGAPAAAAVAEEEGAEGAEAPAEEGEGEEKEGKSKEGKSKEGKSKEGKSKEGKS